MHRVPVPSPPPVLAKACLDHSQPGTNRWVVLSWLSGHFTSQSHQAVRSPTPSIPYHSLPCALACCSFPPAIVPRDITCFKTYLSWQPESAALDDVTTHQPLYVASASFDVLGDMTQDVTFQNSQV